MHTSPRVSIVLPVFDDEEWIEAALESCLRQTLAEIEVICVDDASTDATVEIIERVQQTDARVRLIKQERNRSAFQARRAGILAAEAPYVLFLDGDDELAAGAAEQSLAEAVARDADLVGFGVEVIGVDGRSGGGFQARLQPTHTHLEGDDVLRRLFPADKPAQGQVWRYLFRTTLLRTAYSQMPEDLMLYRANDLPLAFLAAAGAKRFTSLSAQLYRYHFRRGGSGHLVEDIAQFDFYLGAIDSVEAIAPAVREMARHKGDPEPLLDGYESARLSVIANLLNYLLNNVSAELHAESLARLEERASGIDVVRAAVRFRPEALVLIAQRGRRVDLGARRVKSVLLTTKTLTTGGVSGVLLSQARYLMEAGYRVTIVARRMGSMPELVPDGARFVEVIGDDLSARVSHWADICRTESVDVVIDHQILYSRDWPAYALAARAEGAATIGWIHNFAGRPVYDLNDLISLITRNQQALASLVTLSHLDVAFWKLRGLEHVAYLPNPASPMILESTATDIAKQAPGDRIELVWWGRLEQHTKQVRELLVVAAQLRNLGVHFRLTIVGPDWPGLTAEDLIADARKRQLDGYVDVVGTRRGQELIDTIDASHVFINTSVIEGYPLTILEAQARGLPVVMYDLPWLALAEGNDGIVTVPQGDAAALAREIVAIGESPERYAELSQASLDAAQRTREFDFARVYEQLITAQLPAEFSPAPTLEDARRLIDLLVFFAERNAGLRAVALKKERDSDRRSSTRATPKDPPLVASIRPILRRVYRVAPGLRGVGGKARKALGRLRRALSR